MILGLLAFLFFLGSLLCFAGASVKTKTESSGHLFWKDQTQIEVPTEERLAWLGGGLLLMVVAVALAVLLYRIAFGQSSNAGASIESDRPRTVTSGHSKEFWIQTGIAVLGLVIAAISAAAAWRA